MTLAHLAGPGAIVHVLMEACGGPGRLLAAIGTGSLAVIVRHRDLPSVVASATTVVAGLLAGVGLLVLPERTVTTASAIMVGTSLLASEQSRRRTPALIGLVAGTAGVASTLLRVPTPSLPLPLPWTLFGTAIAIALGAILGEIWTETRNRQGHAVLATITCLAGFLTLTGAFP